LRIDFNSLKPIYIQVAGAIEDDIVVGRLLEGEAVYSQLTLSRELSINPATAAKGINQLVSKGILEKQRGLSMTVAVGARDRLLGERRDTEISELAESLVSAAVKVGLSRDSVLDKVSELFNSRERGDLSE